MSAIINKTRKIKKIIFAIDAAVPAMPVNPNKAAIIATTKKINDQLSNIFFVVHP